MKFPNIPKIGSRVFVNSGGYGALGANGQEGTIVDSCRSTGATAGDYSAGIFVRLDNQHTPWRLHPTEFEVSILSEPLSEPLSDAKQKTLSAFNLFNRHSNCGLEAALSAAGIRPLSQSRSLMIQQALIVWFHGSIPDLNYLIELFRGLSS